MNFLLVTYTNLGDRGISWMQNLMQTRPSCDANSCGAILDAIVSLSMVAREKTSICLIILLLWFTELKKVRSRTAMEFGNVSTSNMTPTAVLHASSTTTGNGTSCEKQMQGKKCLLMWKAFEKISHIYADWIDDMPLVHTSLGKVGS